MPSCAPPISASLTEWVALGGGNSGCVANLGTHDYGFHLSALQIIALGRQQTDYSMWRDPNGWDGPFANDDWGCAGDFRHGGDPGLRDRHRVLLARLMAGDPTLHMIAEFIGQPWENRPVYYWSRWGGLEEYTGAGHDMWSHVAWYRSLASLNAPLWEVDDMLDPADKTWLTGTLVPAILAAVRDVKTGLPPAVWKDYKYATPSGTSDMAGWAAYANVKVDKLAATLTASSTAEAARDAALATTLYELRGIITDLLNLVRTAGGNVDVAPIVARLDALPDVIKTAAQDAGRTAAAVALERIAAAQEAEAAAYRTPTT